MWWGIILDLFCGIRYVHGCSTKEEVDTDLGTD
jgi:hypothetical protein